LTLSHILSTMCGICGIVGLEDKGLTGRMMESVRHRGPDDSGTFFDRGVSLGHRRLSIIDLETGRQPVRNEDGSVWVVYNGEIYNYLELKAGLEEAGHRFYTESDTEVLVHLYEEYGADSVGKLRGMFAFAVWDSGRRRLFLARDRLGEKPLYYAAAGGNFIFASEIKAILECGVNRSVSAEALNAYMTHQYVPAPLTMFEGVYKLPAGHRMTAGAEGVEVERYWDIDLKPAAAKTEGQYAAEVGRLLGDSVSMRLMSDVPLGIYLSGGLDSSAVVAFASKMGSRTVKTISVGFEWQGLDERGYARRVAEAFNTEHVELVVDDDAMKSYPEIAWHLDEPLADYAVVPTYLMSMKARKHATVFLTGDGGDELYGGYTKYVWTRRREALFRIPAVEGVMKAAAGSKTIGGFLDGFADSGDVRNVVKSAGDLKATYIRGSRVLDEELKGEVLAGDAYRANPFEKTVAPHIRHALESGGMDFTNNMMYLDVKTWLPEDFLMKTDRSTMAHSIEARAPFLDHMLVQHAFTIPSRMKVSLGGETKRILRKAVGGMLPGEIAGRRKHGFEVPVDDWLKKELKACADEVPGFLDRIGLFRREKAMRMLSHYAAAEKSRDKAYESGRRLWALLYAFKIWHEIFISRERRVR